MKPASKPIIGLLGGSFNPAHAGHVHISTAALHHLPLSRVWWLLSPQNPLKSSNNMAPYQQRKEQALALLAHIPNITLCEFEHHHQLRYSYDSILALQHHYPHYRFVWMMGADNFLQFSQWHHWQDILSLLPVAVFDRGDYGKHIKSSAIHMDIQPFQYSGDTILSAPLPAWCFIHIPIHPASSTQIRNQSS